MADSLDILYLCIIILFMISFAILYLSITNKICKFNNKQNYAEILPNLFLGDITSARNSNFIKTKNIEVIINCSNSIDNFFISSPNIKYYRCPIDDSLTEYDINLMKIYLPQFVKIIDNSLKDNKVVLVHCYAGRQRSAIVIAAYLMYKKGMNIENAYKYIISKRPEAFHYGKSFNFHNSLQDYKQNNL